eukprot:CAMPEP_0204141100 /NCGR_PEP_ID=MMETSP0361-20130328/19314_1 /ASSEMBLY_ACC=CAM_ASM_000343 /TAXON_ID=268821 /ORGANISM="Scrippsiella Hangoei, Strain SHTV-5" /LENGTH=96 /DNA_ID=CAMNT_0051094919 /DNA_START=392 /DNA_END=682 /DNA_ORIENTATION=-
MIGLGRCCLCGLCRDNILALRKGTAAAAHARDRQVPSRHDPRKNTCNACQCRLPETVVRDVHDVTAQPEVEQADKYTIQGELGHLNLEQGPSAFHL